MSNTFLSEFLLITNIHTVLMIFLLIGVFLIISKMSKKLKFNKLRKQAKLEEIIFN